MALSRACVHDDRHTSTAATLAAGAADYDARVAALIGDDDDMAEYLSRLEEIVDDVDDGSIDSAEPVDPEELMNEVEQFLREQE